ncbi:MAG: HEAT repeat domain-containing protein, partial [Woeseiaceae bacterium]
MYSLTKAAFGLLLIVSVPVSNHAAAQIPGIQDDGWHTWQVPAVDGAPDLCCYNWRSGNMSKRHCDLNGRTGGFGSTDDPERADEDVQIYVFMEGSSVSKIRALSSDCPVTVNSKIVDLGPIDADDSAEWLKLLVSSSRRNSAGAIAAIAVHEGSRARDILVDTASHGLSKDHREEAIFWMAQARVSETADALKNFVFEDEDPDIREHAAFSYAQSTA